MNIDDIINFISSTYGILFMLAIGAIVVYLIVSSMVEKHKRRARLMRSLQLSDDDIVAEDALDEFAAMSQDILKMVGIDVAENRKKNYNIYGRAGLLTENAVSKFLFFRHIIQPLMMLIGAVIVMVGLLAEGGPAANLTPLLCGGVFVLAGVGIHDMILDKLSIRRRERLVLDFPDAVDLLLICVESGMGLDAALSRVSRELRHSHPTVTAELERTRIELGLYGDRIQALKNFADRTDLQSYRSLVSALVQTEKYGTNLAATLRTLSKEYRQARLLKAEEKAAKVGALLTLPVVILVFFPVISLIMAPPIIQIMAQGGLFGGR